MSAGVPTQRPPDFTNNSQLERNIMARLRDDSVKFMATLDESGGFQCDLFLQDVSHRERLRAFLASMSLDIDSPKLSVQANGNLDKRAIGAGLVGYLGGNVVTARWHSADWNNALGRDRPSDPNTAAVILESIKAGVAALFQPVEPADLQRLDGVDVDGNVA